MKRFSTFLFSILFVGLVISGCDALEGPEGPEGPRGPEGPQGPQGPPGTANIETVEVSYTQADAEIEGNVASVVWSMSEITQNVYEDGAVQADFQTGENNFWIALPWTVTTDQETVEITYSYAEETFGLFFFSNQDQIDRSSIPEGTVKVTVIPPSSTSNVSTSKHKAKNFGVELESN